VIKLTQLSLLLAVFFLISIPAKAGLLIEPVLGFNMGTKLDFPTKNYSGGKGMGYGGRLGFQKLGFQLGADYLHSSIDMNETDIKRNVALTEWAGFIGYEFPVLLRVYAGYIFSAKGETKLATGTAKVEDGTGTKVGIGFTGIPFLDINLEYRAGTFDTYRLAGVKQSGNIDYSTYMLSLSLPFNL
jgi:Outer membrane protein beta-barrel domain